MKQTRELIRQCLIVINRSNGRIPDCIKELNEKAQEEIKAMEWSIDEIGKELEG